MPGRLLVLSNGHGEDLIALRILQALHRRRPELEIAVLPLVGEGGAFAAAEEAGVLRRIGPRRHLPSGGFSNQSLRGLLADLGAGVLGLSWRQWRLVRRWGRRGDPVLAVGDLLPLLLAWGSGAPYGFIGTPKSDYTWASGPGSAGLAALYHRCKGSEWDPWEWTLMARRRCRLVAMRDALTARGLRRHGVDALAPGNPMMDGLRAEPLPPVLQGRRRLLLLGGSRMPEALGNLRRLLEALELLSEAEPLLLLAPCGSRPSPEEWAPLLQRLGFEPVPGPPPGEAAAAWQRGSVLLVVGPGRFAAWAGCAEVGLAAAGTATEQLVGLGVPALSLPGPGPQFKLGFAQRQSRLLGGSVAVCRTPQALAQGLEELLNAPQRRAALGRIGARRMGPAGGSEALAQLLEERLLTPAAGPGGMMG
ncbi:MAG: sugar synthetase [Cyanobacteria bacterium M_surface_7_m2_037]|nr:sugar synthetase [Cyanobacteria bacterium K_DeepCast_0m_m1_088]MBM5794627.1 sugar synthetase [Cyanobacteria bacterium M_surface_7_m2_037]MBM5818600.1 sugar synthetase [Cyanobacteria bacterium K_DeepCast_150m_m2_101]